MKKFIASAGAMALVMSNAMAMDADREAIINEKVGSGPINLVAAISST